MEISQLPEECISLIISLTSPRDACRSSLVSPRFRSASESDSVWEKFLPCDYRHFVSQSREFSAQILNSMPKKSLYLHLCDNPIIIADGNLSFSLDKPTGKKCFMVGARGLSIAWGDTPRYWRWEPLPDESRFSEVAKLVMVWWLHIFAKFETSALSPHTTYEAYLVFKLSQRAHQFKDRPVDLHVHFEGHDHDGEGVINAFLSPQNADRSRNNPDPPFLPQDRRDGWSEIKMGQFFNENGEDGSVLCNLREITCSYVWSGLTIEGIELRPKALI